jgi:multidrug efflux pump subunit AcrA (membrane-fusion protein)
MSSLCLQKQLWWSLTAQCAVCHSFLTSFLSQVTQSLCHSLHCVTPMSAAEAAAERRKTSAAQKQARKAQKQAAAAQDEVAALRQQLEELQSQLQHSQSQSQETGSQ